MITVETSRSGLPILKEEGRLLASSFDPVKEAETWADHVEPLLGPGAVAIIVGIGAGYHIAALKARRPSLTVLALDASSEIADHALKFNPSLTALDVIVESDRLALTQAPRLHDAMGGHYVPLVHGPTAQQHPEWCEAVFAFLLGRDKLSFLLQLRLRPELFALLEPARIAEIANEPISIKTLQRAFRADAGRNRERRLWRVLEELVL